jgi:serine O-acetyltransferase
MHGVTLGAPTLSRIGDMPKLGARVTVGAQASIIGPVTVGDDVFIGAHALVTRDVPPGSRVVARVELEIRPSSSPAVSA